MHFLKLDESAPEAKQLDIVPLGPCERQVFEITSCLRLKSPQLGKPKPFSDPSLFWRAKRLSNHWTCGLSLSSRLKQITGYFEYLVQHPVDLSRRPLFTYSDRDQECLRYFFFPWLELPEYRMSLVYQHLSKASINRKRRLVPEFLDL